MTVGSSSTTTDVAEDAPDAPDASPPMHPIDRREAFAKGAPGIPHKVIYWVLGAVLVLGVGGTLLTRVVTTLGNAPTRSKNAPLTSGAPIAHGAGGHPSGVAALHAPLASLLHISSLRSTPAPGFSLTDAASGKEVTLASLRGHVVVLSFANAACDDICPVLSAELSKAASLLGPTKVPVTFVTVNTDPLELGTGGGETILSQPTLAHLTKWRFLTGNLGELNSVWKNYGIAITAERSKGIASHNDLLYFIDPQGNFAWTAVPFANESKSGAFTLTPDAVTRFAQGIAHYAQRLEPAS
ncbi:MAG: SCO family protein [Acidimicrobiales bacterium]